MAKRSTKAAAEKIVTLPADLRVGTAREVWSALESAGEQATVVIDASSVSKVDASGLQLLAATVVRFRTAGVKWRWQDPSEVLHNAARLAGLNAALELQ